MLLLFCRENGACRCVYSGELAPVWMPAARRSFLAGTKPATPFENRQFAKTPSPWHAASFKALRFMLPVHAAGTVRCLSSSKRAARLILLFFGGLWFLIGLRIPVCLQTFLPLPVISCLLCKYYFHFHPSSIHLAVSS